MADNLTMNAGSGGAVLAADDLSTYFVPRTKLMLGADGVNDGDVSSANPMPVAPTSQQVDDAAFTPGTGKVLMIGAECDDTSPDSVNEGDGGAIRMSANRALYTQLRDAAGNERGLNVDANGAISTVVSTIGVGATHLGKAEDAVHASGDTGVMALAVRKNTATQLAGADGDYSPLITDANGRLHVISTVTGVVDILDSSGDLTRLAETLTAVVDSSGPAYVVNAGTFAVQAAVGAGATTIGKSEDAASANGDVGVPAYAVRKATPANTSGTDGDYEPLQVSAGRLWTSDVVTDLIPGVGATNLGKAEDAAHTTGDTGVMGLAVRNDSLAALAGTTGDYIPLTTDSSGRLWTTTSVSSIVPGTGATNLGKQEDAVHGTGDTGVMALGVRKDTAAQLAGSDGDYCPPIFDSSGRQHVNVGNTVSVQADLVANSFGTLPVEIVSTVSPIEVDIVNNSSGPLSVSIDAYTSTLDVSGSTVSVSGSTVSVTAIVPGNGASNLGKAEDAAHASGDTGVMGLGVRRDVASQLAGTDGDYCPPIFDASGRQHVNVGTVVPGTGATNLGKAEDAAHASGDTGVMALAVRNDSDTVLTSANGDYAPLSVDASGYLRVYDMKPDRGVTVFRSLDLDEGSAEVVIAAPANLYGGWITNRSTGTRWIKIYDRVSATVGTHTPVITIGIPGNSTDNIAAVLGTSLGVGFDTGICIGCSTGFADADTGAPGDNDVIINLFYNEA